MGLPRCWRTKPTTGNQILLPFKHIILFHDSPLKIISVFAKDSSNYVALSIMEPVELTISSQKGSTNPPWVPSTQISRRKIFVLERNMPQKCSASLQSLPTNRHILQYRLNLSNCNSNITTYLTGHHVPSQKINWLVMWWDSISRTVCKMHIGY